jgi:hypothetical protein
MSEKNGIATNKALPEFYFPFPLFFRLVERGVQPILGEFLPVIGSQTAS